jgi:hypothetical protein
MRAGRTPEPSRSRRMQRKQLVVLHFGQGLIGLAVSLKGDFGGERIGPMLAATRISE